MKEIYIERHKQLLRIAIKENGKLKECFIEEENNEPIPGQIYKGIIKNIVPAIKCAFVDVGYNKNCYMYLDRKFNNINIKKGDEVIVEVVKESLDKKGAKVTNLISIPGTYTVLTTEDNNISFSKKITDGNFIEMINKSIEKPEGVGIKLRTNAINVDINVINSEINNLYSLYIELMKKATYSQKIGLLYSDNGVLDRTLRDMIDYNTNTIILNNIDDYEHTKKFIKSRTDVNTKVELHDEARALLDYYGIEKEILSLRNNKVYLNCGGNIVIEKTEAMYVVDVNSGTNVKSRSLKKTSEVTNLEAAEEIARQIRLRNLSGIIVVDFIDVEDENIQYKIIKALKNGFCDDKNKTVIYPFTELNLVQIARRRRGKSIYDYIEEVCPVCRNRGSRIKLSYIEFLIRNHIANIDKEQGIDDIYIEIDNIYEKDIKEDVLSFVRGINAIDKKVYVNFIPHLEKFKIEALIFNNQIKNLQIYKIYG